MYEDIVKGHIIVRGRDTIHCITQFPNGIHYAHLTDEQGPAEVPEGDKSSGTQEETFGDPMVPVSMFQDVRPDKTSIYYAVRARRSNERAGDMDQGYGDKQQIKIMEFNPLLEKDEQK